MTPVKSTVFSSVAVAAAVFGLGFSVALYSHVVSAAPRAAADAAAAEAAAPLGVAAGSAHHPAARHGRAFLDRSGRRQVGKASFYADRYAGRTMSDGTPMRPNSNNAASVTLPLGTTAQVTNLETGSSAIVTIRDRGPYVKGRIIDLSPATARVIGLDKRKGLARVEVLPLAVPQVDGSLRRTAANVGNRAIDDRG